MSQTTSAMTQMVCSFCKGSGRDPFDLLSEFAVCQVCGGTGHVEVEEPAIKCAFCKGSGIYHESRITCTVCGGKGMVTAPKGETTQCTECKGTGIALDSRMPCLRCKGKGIVSK